MQPIATGTLADNHPYARVGTGPQPLVVIPGIDDAMFSGRYPRRLAWALYWYFSRYTQTHTIYVISRPRGLSEEMTITEMADEYATVLTDTIAPTDILGVSMGGMIAQSIAIHYPTVVDRLILANTGTRLTDIDTLDRFRDYASTHNWAAIRAELAAVMFSDWRSISYPPIARTVGRYLAPTPAVPSDVSVSLNAIRRFDATNRLPDITAATLVFGGSDDPFFPYSVLTETADAIPTSTRTVIDGAKHGAFHEYKVTFDTHATRFLTPS